MRNFKLRGVAALFHKQRMSSDPRRKGLTTSRRSRCHRSWLAGSVSPRKRRRRSGRRSVSDMPNTPGAVPVLVAHQIGRGSAPVVEFEIRHQTESLVGEDAAVPERQGNGRLILGACLPRKLEPRTRCSTAEDRRCVQKLRQIARIHGPVERLQGRRRAAPFRGTRPGSCGCRIHPRASPCHRRGERPGSGARRHGFSRPPARWKNPRIPATGGSPAGPVSG